MAPSTAIEAIGGSAVGAGIDHALLDVLPVAIYATDADGYVTYFNRAAADLAGREPVIGRDKWCVSWRLYTPDGTPIPHDQCPMAIALREKRPVRGTEAILERPDGSRVPCIPYPTPLFGADGELIGAVNMLVDISDRKDTEAAIRNQSERLRSLNLASEQLAAIVESSDDAIISKDLNGVIVSWNQGAERLFGYSSTDVIGKPVTVLIPQDRLHEEPRILERLRHGERIDHYETVRRRKDGSLVDISLTVSPVRDDSGRIVGASKIARDISPRKRAEAAIEGHLNEQAALFALSDAMNRAQTEEDINSAALDAIQRALRCSRASVLLTDETGVMRFVAWRGLSAGYRAAVEGHSPWDLSDPDPRPVVVADVSSADLPAGLKTKVMGEGIRACAFIPLVVNGRLIGKFMAYHDRPHVFPEGEIALGLAIARQLAFGVIKRRAETDLRDNEERLRLATEAGKVGVWEWDITNNRVTWTDSIYAMHGLNKGEFDGTLEAFAGLVHPDDRERVAKQIRESLAGDEHPYQLEFRVTKPDGNIGWLFTNARVMRDGGKPVRLIGATLDITERKESDAQRDLLVAELSHRVKNTLATVISIAHQSFSKGPSPEEARRSFDGRIRALAQTHGRLAEGSWSGVSFETMLNDELAPYRGDDGGNVRLAGPRIMLSPKQAVVLGMAFHELATNAAKYGALSTKSGIVGVTWEIAREPSELRIRWTESGGPPVRPPTRSGFGRLLLERALVADLQGKVEMSFAETGLRSEIVVPLDATKSAPH